MLEPYNPAILPLTLYPEELKAHSGRDISTSLFTGALFTIAKTCKQPKYPLIKEWLNPSAMCIY